MMHQIKRFLVCYFLITCMFSCSKQKVNLMNDNFEAYKDYISAYSAGILKRNEAVRIEFTKPVITADQINQELNLSSYKISPSLEGKCIWKSVNILEFYPDKQSLRENQEYQFSLDIKTFFPEISESLRTLSLNFSYLPLEISVKWQFPRMISDQPDKMYLTGILRVNDIIEPGKILESFEIKMKSGRKIIPHIEVSASDPFQYEILIKPIDRQANVADQLQVQWKQHFNEDAKILDSKLFQIPALNEFVVMGVDDAGISQHNMTIYFSDALLESQDIRGLVVLKGDSVALELTKDKDLINVHIPDSWDAKKAILSVSHLIQSKDPNKKLIAFEYPFVLNPNPPEVRFTNTGSILPYSKNIILPFEAINLHTIEVEVFKTFANNVLFNMHLGFNDDYDGYNMVRLGRIVKQKIIKLEDLSQGSNEKEWKRYGLDLSELIEAEIGAFYQVRICFKPGYSNYYCAGGKPEMPEDYYDEYTGDSKIKSFWRAYAYYNYSENGNNDTQDPCNLSYYYKDHFAKTSFFASNLAMIAKSSDHGGDCFVAVYDVQDGSPVKSAEITYYDAQLQILALEKTDGNGTVNKVLPVKPAFIVAKSGKHISYLKIEENKSLSQSEFDISGVKLQEGLKASLYTERGVWRPGDTIYFSAIIHQIERPIPAQFPVELTIYNPQNQIIFKKQKADHLMGLYAFQIPTKETDLTGIYKAQLKIGLSVFEKNLLVETVKPNRFKVEWPFQKEFAMESFSSGIPFSAKWLHGSPADGKQTNISVKYQMVTPDFKKFAGYVFIDPESKSVTGEQEVFNARLNEKGEGRILFPGIKDVVKSGKLRTTFITQILDDGGDLTTDYFESTVSPFKEFVGVKLPENPYGRQISVGVDQEVKVVVLDADGKAIANRDVSIELFRVSYEWWYELRSGHMGDYQRNIHQERLLNQTIKSDQNGIATMKINLKEYDRYYIKVTNKYNGYVTGEYFYTGWNYNSDSKEFVNILSFKTDKDNYGIGDKVKIDLPGATKGMYLISFLRGTKILKTQSVAAKKEKTPFEFQVSKEMAPNIYVDVSFVQGRLEKKNDLPLRLYGIIPVRIENSDKKLLPIIKMSDNIRPDEKFTIEISEEKSREMVYQLYVVDEGLLNLTRFKTPNPYNDIMAKEALSLMTWDNFNEIIGNLDGEMERVFSIGGDQALNKSQEQKNKRFKPIVLNSGPVVLKKGERNKHEFVIQNYIGSVRVMVIANEQNAFGSAEKSVAVKNELMTQLTVPRVFAYNDEVLIPVTVFASDERVKNVQVTLDVKGKIQLTDPPVQNISFKQLGDQTVFFRVRGDGGIGNASITASAKSGSFNASNTIHFYVDNPNVLSHEVKQFWVEPGQEIHENIGAFGMEGTRSVKLEVSGLHGLSIHKLLDDLIQYPHGCLEQITSGAFPQIFLSSLVELSVERKSDITNNIQIAIDKLRRFQLSDGSFSYWPGLEDYSDWNTSYVGHFLIETKNAGYRVPDDLLKSWYNFQRTRSNAFVPNIKGLYHRPELMQAYRLYTMSLYGKPEWSAMNQLFQNKGNDLMTSILLAGAYAASGKKEIATQLISNLAFNELNYYRELAYSYGSNTRDEALIAQVLVLLDRKSEASNLLKKLIQRTSSNYFYSTQEMSMILVAVAKLNGDNKDHKMKFSYKWNTTQLMTETGTQSYFVDLKPASKQTFDFKNLSNSGVSVSLVQYGKETSIANMDKSNGLKLKYEIVSGNSKDLNFESGDQLNIRVTVSNIGTNGRLDNLALNLVVPSGIELENRRIGGIDSKNSRVDYQDYRDAKIISYFSLNTGETMAFNFPAIAAYPGKYIAPGIYCEAMYNPSIYAAYRYGVINIKSRN
ncbi:MAG: MG2 domain-containing protein [Saprospiraceae bacterium]